MDLPKITHNGIELFQVGCRKCQQGNSWKIYSDGKVFVAECKCGHRIELGGKSLTGEPDPKTIPLRQVQ